MHYRADPDDKTKTTDEVSIYEFRVGSYHWYRDDLDVGVLTGKMLNNGFEYPEVQPAINEITRQFAELNAQPAGPFPGKRPRRKGQGQGQARGQPRPRTAMTTQHLPSWSELHPSRGFAAGLPAALRRHVHRRRRR